MSEVDKYVPSLGGPNAVLKVSISSPVLRMASLASCRPATAVECDVSTLLVCQYCVVLACAIEQRVLAVRVCQWGFVGHVS